MLGVVLSIMPLVIRQPLAGATPSHFTLALIPLGPLAVLAGLGFWMRRTLLSTVLNRTLVGAGVLALIGQTCCTSWRARRASPPVRASC